MFERFTDRARKVMQLANQEAQRLHHEYVRTEHILLGLVKEGSGVAANVLQNLKIDLHKVRSEVERLVPYASSESPVQGRLPQTPRTKKVIEYAIEEARLLNHNYVGTEHLLLGLLCEPKGVAAEVLTALGLKLEDVREEVMNLLGDSTPMVGGAAPAYESPEPTPDVAPPPPELTTEQIQLIRERIEELTQQKESFAVVQDFAQAAECRDEAQALSLLLAWYEWFQK